MNDLKSRLTSRALWIAIGTIIVMVANKQYTEAASVASAYILGERVADAAGRFNK